jgi:3'-phosphoadenosine 5'-phosphosulfate (PAPS) 3'-phosphatase
MNFFCILLLIFFEMHRCLPWKLNYVKTLIGNPNSFWRRRFSTRATARKVNQNDQYQEYLISHVDNTQNTEFSRLIDDFMKVRPQIQLVSSSDSRIIPKSVPSVVWYLAKDKLILDVCVLENHYLSGKQQLSMNEMKSVWNNKLQKRVLQQENFLLTNISEEEKYLNLVRLVERLSNIARSIQYSFSPRIFSTAGVKVDNSPVTFLDYTIQLILIHFLRNHFPDDYFLVEESLDGFQHFLLENETALVQILEILRLFFPAEAKNWEKNDLLEILQYCEERKYCDTKIKSGLDSHQAQNRKIWVIDPIDGTRGFLSNKHYCIALSAVDVLTKKPVFSTISSPNINMFRVIEGLSLSKPDSILSSIAIDPPLLIEKEEDEAGVACSQLPLFPSPYSGCLLYDSENDECAFARSYSMSTDAALPLSPSDDQLIRNNPLRKTWIVCFPLEGKHHNHNLTNQILQRISSEINHTIIPLFLHSQCKYSLLALKGDCIQGFLKVSSDPNYQEKVYDHIPGIHFLEVLHSSNGNFTNLNGEKILFDYSQGILSNTCDWYNSSNGFIVTTDPTLHRLLVKYFGNVELR